MQVLLMVTTSVPSTNWSFVEKFLNLIGFLCFFPLGWFRAVGLRAQGPGECQDISFLRSRCPSLRVLQTSPLSPSPLVKFGGQRSTMGEDAAGKNTEEDRNKKWEMAFTARMRQIVPGLFLGNVEASYKREMLQENCIDAIVSLTDARWVCGTPSQEMRFQNTVTNGFSVQTRRPKIFLLI